MSVRSHQARHRAGRPATTKLRLLVGTALPTAAAVALMFTATMFTATGAAMATSPRTQSVISDQSAAAFSGQNADLLTVWQPTAVDPQQMRTHHLITVEQVQAFALQNEAVVRAAAAARVARSAARQELAARRLDDERAARAHSWRLPITNPVKTSGFGYRWGSLHAGEDFAVPIGTDLASMSTGTVAFAGAESGYGSLVQIRYWDGTISYFAHMSSISVTVGKNVEPGEIVGQSGNSGHSTGPHLHLEIHPDGGAAIDPLPWLARHKIAT